MKKQDVIFALGFILLFLPFFVSRSIFDFYIDFNKAHGMITSFVKFAILATIGEIIGLRLRTGKYYQKGFGVLPRAIVWGFLGLSIKLAFVIFAAGSPVILSYLGVSGAEDAIMGSFSGKKLLVAFSISLFLNLFYAPVLMTFHKITDVHIIENGGTLSGFFKPIQILKILINLNWDVHWNFVIKKTIPLFWIPAQTITFLLPVDFQVLFAAFLGVVLGVLLAFASLKSSK
ncbi:Mpv17/PMP22 family protein [Labilibaculum sp.]|uniref:Mpv17/PMP22 family protein n=1 Tax=Labilibaculum sp. TaxID=2060723 RepID=UPI0035697B27